MYRSKFQSYRIETTRLDNGSFDVVANVELGKKSELNSEWETKEQEFHSNAPDLETALMDILLTTNEFLQDDDFSLLDSETELLN